jgi:serine/threonine protein kinase
LQRILGRGGCGFVILAYDKKLGRDVAVKFLERNTEIERQRLRREGRALAEMDRKKPIPLGDGQTRKCIVFNRSNEN